MAINRSTQQRQNYGLGSFVKKAFNKVTRPFTKVAQKLMPKELAGVARMAAPFAAASGIPYAALIGGGLSAAGQAKQKGRINPFETAFAAAPGLRFAGGEGLGQFGITGVGGKTGAGRNTLRDLFLRGDITAGETLRDKPIFGEYGTKADEFLFGKPGEDLRFGEERMVPGTGETELARFAATKPEKGLLGLGGEFDLFNSKAVDLAIRTKDGKKLSPLKIGAWGMSIYSGIKAAQYKDEMEAADAAEQALLAADATASEGDILEAREWAQTVFGRLSRADIGLAQGGRVNYAMGTPGGIGSLPDPGESNEENSGIVIEDEYNPKDFMIEQFQETGYPPRILGEGFQGGEKIFVIETPRGVSMIITEEDYTTKFGKTNRAEGGRIGYRDAGPVLPEDPTKPVNPFAPKPTGPVLPDKMMAEFDIGEYFELFEKANPQFKGMNRDSDDYKFYFEDYWRGLANKKQEGNTMMAANGGLMRTNYALGTKPEPKESGLGGLPIEADMRYSGGFMPYGKKEKADDVPARLSKNEFVFTADAVKAAGGGSMNEGARKMYQTMKMLEQQNRMMS